MDRTAAKVSRRTDRRRPSCSCMGAARPCGCRRNSVSPARKCAFAATATASSSSRSSSTCRPGSSGSMPAVMCPSCRRAASSRHAARRRNRSRQMICLDTNAAIALLSGDQTSVRSRFEEAVALGEEIAVSSVVLFELWFGAAKSARREANAGKIATFLASPIRGPGLRFRRRRRSRANPRALCSEPGRRSDLTTSSSQHRRGAGTRCSSRRITREFARVTGTEAGGLDDALMQRLFRSAA